MNNKRDVDNISLLVKKIIEEKQFIFKEEQLPFDINLLIQEDVLKRDSNRLMVTNSPLLVDELYLQLCQLLRFKMTSRFDETQSFFENVENYFRKEGYINGLSEKLDELLKLLIIKSNKDFKVIFDNIIEEDVTKKNDFIFDFITVFPNCLLELEIEPNHLYPILKFLCHQILSDQTLNGYMGELMNGVQQYSTRNPTAGEAVLTISMNDISQPFEISAAIIAGLYNQNHSKLKEIEKLLNNSNNIIPVVKAFYRMDVNSNEEAVQVLDIVDNIEISDEAVAINLPNFYGSLIRNSAISTAIKSRCFNRLDTIFIQGSINIRFSVLGSINFVHGFEEEIYEIVNKLNNSVFDERFGHIISSIFANLSDPKYYFLFIKNYALLNRLTFKARVFSYAIERQFTVNKELFTRNLSDLLIDDEGVIRFVGNAIVRHIAQNEKIDFGFALTDFSAVQQYKLWVALLDIDSQPENSLPMALPLRKSKYPFVVFALLYKIEDLIESFGRTVIEILESNFDLANINDVTILERMNNKVRDFKEWKLKKGKIKELNPLYTQTKLLYRYDKVFSDKLNEGLNKEVRDNSIFAQFATTVILAKGGGWKLENKQEVSQLGVVESPFQLPRSYFLSPDMFDLEIRRSFIKNWSKEFEQWEATISSLENI